MSDAFDQFESYVRTRCGTEPICVHTGDVQLCEIAQHPNYRQFRANATVSARNSTRSHLWESMVALGRQYEMNDDDRWLMILLYCLIPSLRGKSWEITRKMHIDIEDVRSDMTEAALAAWRESDRSVSPRHVPHHMVGSAITTAYKRAKAYNREYSVDEVEDLLPFAESLHLSPLKASSIIHGVDQRDAAVAEQVRGERYGALFYHYNCLDTVMHFHAEIRAGRHPGPGVRATTPSMLARIGITGPNHYYYVSSIYPRFVGLPIAAEILGIAESAAYRRVRAGSFPCPPTRMGGAYKVPTRALMHCADIPDDIVHPDDVENGAAHAGGSV